MKKHVFIAAAILGALTANAQHNIVLTDTVFVGSSISTITHEELEPVWSMPTADLINVFPLFNEQTYTVCRPNLPDGEYHIALNITEDEWFATDTATSSSYLCDSDGFAFIINENLATEDMVTFMAYRGETLYNLSYTGDIYTIRLVSSTSTISYNSLDIYSVTSHTDTVTVMRVASPFEGHPNPTTETYYFSEYMDFAIFNNLGQKVADGFGDQFNFLAANLPSGTYFVNKRGTTSGERVIFVRQ